ncbi:MAG: hypothetical protein K8I02_12785, partial [Candidatus Methylomirabilis sp.]|nr:hypothetical protein [Deltaproteobacteria bacterium]
LAAAPAPVVAGDGEACMTEDAFPKRLRRSPEDSRFLEICSMLDRSDEGAPKEELEQTVALIRSYLGGIFAEPAVQFVLHDHTAPGKTPKEVVEDILDALAPHGTWKDLRDSAFRHVLCGDFHKSKDGVWTMEGGANSGLHTRLRYEALLDEGAICQTKDMGRPFGGEVAEVSYRIKPKGEKKLAGAIDVDDSVADHVAVLLEFNRTVCALSEGGQCRRALVKKEISGEEYPYTVWCKTYSDGKPRIYTAYPRACPGE